MSIPANKADNKTPAYDIKLKRTEKTQTDSSIKDGILEYGEALYNKTDNTLMLGNGTSTIENSKVAKLVAKSNADTMIFYTAQSPDNGIVTLRRETSDESTKPEIVYPKIKFWNTIDSSSGASSISFDFNSTGNWEYYNGSEWVSLGSGKPSSSQVPARKTISIPGITENDKICISLCLANSQVINLTSLKESEKVFGTITSVESYGTTTANGGIIIYCKKIRAYTNSFCYLNVFGG